MRETDLHEPIARWLQGQGYHVSAEVHHCDLVATHPNRREDPIIVELKTRMSLDLVTQGVARQEISPSVYLAVHLAGSRGRLRNGRRVLTLLRRLGLGLLVVRSLRSGTRVEVVLHPGTTGPRHRPQRRATILREIDGRFAELNRAGQASTDERFSAYRQRAIRVAAILRDTADGQPAGIAPAAVRAAGGPADAQQILSRNHYGWFDRVTRGRYTLNDAGRAALDRYAAILPQIRGTSY